MKSGEEEAILFDAKADEVWLSATMGRGTQTHLFPKHNYTSNSGNKTTTKKRTKYPGFLFKRFMQILLCGIAVPCMFVFLSLALTWDQMTRWTKTCALIQWCPHLPPLPMHTRCTNSHPPMHKQGHGLPRHHLEHQGWLAQPFASSWEPGSLTATHCKNHNIMKSRTAVKGTHQPHITLEMDVNCGSKSTYNFYAMSSSFCILALLIPEGIREVHPRLQRATYK